jgi:aryl carrier-like protein
MNRQVRLHAKQTLLAPGAGLRDFDPARRRGRLLDALSALLRRLFGETPLAVSTSEGTDSLRAVHLVHRLRRQTGLPLSLRVPFETPTISEIARSLDVLATSDRAHDLALLDRLRELPTTPETERITL